MKHLRGLRRARWESADPALAAPGSYGIPERDATRRARIVLLWRALLLRWSAERDLSIMGVIWERLLRLRRNQERYRWYALGVTTFTQAAASAVTSALGPIAPLIMAEFAISRAQVGARADLDLPQRDVVRDGGRPHRRSRRRADCAHRLGVDHGSSIRGRRSRWPVLGVPRRRVRRRDRYRRAESGG